ncbi:class I SAM-dependent methyltransferase [Rhodopirellula baltica]|uniref:class I SAM-dependent methyltransferase n=1 Tax=Rhodopirellula baltica TaxID=265606 RepID=UPI00135F17F0|nr:class I SAM-dependent methyltransferase [Rhodopirellula baltica]
MEIRQSCPACGSRNALKLYSSPFSVDPLDRHLKVYYGEHYQPEMLANGSFILERCNSCTLVFQKWVPNSELLNSLYGKWLSSSQLRPELPADHKLATSRDGQEVLMIASVVQKRPEDLQLLDYGMGWGYWGRAAIAVGVKSIFGFDLAAERMEEAAAKGITAIELDQVPNGTIDFINTEQVFEHLVDPFGVLQSLAPKLNVNGILKISVPKANDLQRRLAIADWDAPKYSKNSLHSVHPLEHVNCWSARSVLAMAKRLGLVEQSRPFQSYYSFIGKNLGFPAPKDLLKGLARPIYHRYSRNNLYLWLRRG